MHIRKIAGQKAEVSLDEPINMDADGNEMRLSDILGTEEDVVSGALEEAVDRKLLYQALEELPDRLRNFTTMLVVLFGWVLFSHTDFGELGIAIRGMLGFNGLSAAGTGTVLTNALPLIAVCLIGCSRLPKTVKQVFAGMCGMYGKRRKRNAIDAGKIVYVTVCFLFTCLLIWLSVVSMIGTTSTPSLYADF
jgi:hypothetical protein